MKDFKIVSSVDKHDVVEACKAVGGDYLLLLEDNI